MTTRAGVALIAGVMAGLGSSTSVGIDRPAHETVPWCTLPAPNSSDPTRLSPLPGSISINEVEPNDSFESATDGRISHLEPNINVLGTLDGNEDDYVFVELVRGDVLGVALLSGDFDSRVMVLDPNNNILVFNDTGFTFYPEASQLPITAWETDAGAAIVAHTTGRYTIIIDASINDPSPSGTYNMQLRLRRNPLETAPGGTKHILYIDFDGEAIIPRNLFGLGTPALVNLIPLDGFLVDWGLTLDDRDLLIDSVVQRVEESLAFATGPNALAAYEVRNSRDHADPFGVEPNVTRCIVGGTISQTGIQTIGIAESIDPGNQETSETSLVLLDLLSDPNPANPNSLNNWELAPGFSKPEAIGRALGNLVVHEIGHTLGCYHTENLNQSHCLMDAGGGFFYLSYYQSGPDFILGNEDDNDTNFIVDLYANEGIALTPVSRQYTNARVGFGLTGPPAPCSADSNDDAIVNGIDLGGILSAWRQPVFLLEDINQDNAVDGGDLGLLIAGWGQPGPSDLDGDGTTNGADMGLLISAWGMRGNGEFDLNIDGAVNSADLGILLAQWGVCP
ncbi:MAG: hypothetical protein ACF8GE_10650 [Phycisphaerales bacterium JB043]